MSFDTCFIGKRALVTGAGTGIGRAVVIALYNRGCTVYALSKTEESLVSLQKQLPSVIPIGVDLTDWYNTKQTLEALECMDILVNNAGIADPSDFLSVTSHDFDAHMSVNVKAVINVSQIVAKKMISDNRPGAIVNVSSVRGLQAWENAACYCTTKAALEMLSKVLAIELGPHKITVNSVNPAMVVTDMPFDFIDKVADKTGQSTVDLQKTLFELLMSRTPTKDIVMPMSDVVNAILFFASGLTSQITGSNLKIDGGYLIN